MRSVPEIPIRWCVIWSQAVTAQLIAVKCNCVNQPLSGEQVVKLYGFPAHRRANGTTYESRELRNFLGVPYLDAVQVLRSQLVLSIGDVAQHHGFRVALHLGTAEEALKQTQCNMRASVVVRPAF